MAHIVGVPRRDPCHKCNLPVFLAERLLVGKKVYHRTCLKCARCGSQLTPGSFYETEIDDQYCCETCPDEEVMDSDNDLLGNGKKTDDTGHNVDNVVDDVELRSKNANELLSPPPMLQKGTSRNSIKERLAFFEKTLQSNYDKNFTKSDYKIRPKSNSISDEEKTKDVKRSESLSPYKMSSAFNTFLNDTVIESNTDQGIYKSKDKDNGNIAKHETLQENLVSSTQQIDDNCHKIGSVHGTANDIRNDVSLPPTLPKSLPPSFENDSLENIKDKSFKRFTASTHLILSGTSTDESSTDFDIDLDNGKLPSSQNRPDELKFHFTTIAPTNFQLISDESNNEKIVTPEGMQLKSEVEPKTKIQSESESKPNSDLETLSKPQPEPALEPPSVVKTQKNAEESIIPNQSNIIIENIKQLDFNGYNHNINNDCSTTKDKVVADKDEAGTCMKTEVTAQTIENASTDNENEIKIDESLMENDISVNSRAEEDMEITERLSVVRHRLQQFEVLKMPNTENFIESPEDEVMKKDNNDTTESITGVEIELNTENEKNKNEETISTSIEFNELEKEIKQKETNVKSSNSLTPHKTMPKKSIEEYPKDLDPFKSDEEDDTQEEVIEQETSNRKALDTAANKENLVQTLSSQKSPRAKLPESRNPFNSSDDEIELEKLSKQQRVVAKIPPPRPPPPRISRNPFGEDVGNDEINSNINFNRRSSLNTSQSRKTPVPTPRTNKSQSQNPTPEATPRLHTKITTPSTSPHSNTTSIIGQSASLVLQNSSGLYGSTNSLVTNSTATTPNHLLRNSDIRRSNTSLNISSGGTIRSRKSRRAPLPPVSSSKELFPSNETINTLSSISSTPNSSAVGTPKLSRKKRPAPPPPKPARIDTVVTPVIAIEGDINETQTKNSFSYPLQSDLDSKLSDEEKALLEGKKRVQQQTKQQQQQQQQTFASDTTKNQELTIDVSSISRSSSKRIIPLDKELMEEHGSVLQIADSEQLQQQLERQQQDQNSQCDDLKEQQQQKQNALQQQHEEETNVVYRRLLVPPDLKTPTHEENPFIEQLSRSSSMGQRQLEKLKDNKEAKNRNRQSQLSTASSGAEDNDPLFNKSLQGKWKRRKGPAPALPVPPRRVLQMLPLQEIKHELEIIEVQQQGLEKQGVILEKMIRDRCEGVNGELLKNSSVKSGRSSLENVQDSNAIIQLDNGGGDCNSKEVEYLILQLFELVNEKNELFRRQAELMYLRRQHRLEQEQADLEYEIRVLMAQPERNKTDSDKAREEVLIERLVELVQLRNEVVDCLEMDRIRENEEDQSIKQRLESHIAKRDEKEDVDAINKSLMYAKLSKKEKKKQKEAKKVSKSKKIDADKDADESEMKDKQKTKKKRKIFLF